MIIAIKATALITAAIIFFGIASVLAYRAFRCVHRSEDKNGMMWAGATLVYFVLAIGLWLVIVRLLFPDFMLV